MHSTNWVGTTPIRPSPNQPQAIYWLCQAAAQGHVSAQMRLASIFENDAGIPVAASNRLSNRGSAYFWYTAAASQGNDQGVDQPRCPGTRYG